METHKRQYQLVLAIEVALVAITTFLVYEFWNGMCSDGFQECLSSTGPYRPLAFLLLAAFRPLLLTPFVVLSMMGGASFGPYVGTLLAATGGVLSCLLLYLPGKLLGARYIHPWLSANLPATWQLIRTQDYKVAFATRWIPFFPFDLLTIIFGVLGFRTRATILATFAGILPETYIMALISSSGAQGEAGNVGLVTLTSLSVLAALTLLPLAVFEISNRRSGNSLIFRMSKMFGELKSEAAMTNATDAHYEWIGKRTPILLLYGFFSSRKSLVKMEGMLHRRGFDVITIDQGGLFGVFNTSSIRQLAKKVDREVEEKMLQHNFDKIHVVAHSKGALVALWWLLKLGGSRYTDKIITMGAPFKGSYLTYLALVTPLGLFWRDVYQMRPGSEILKEIHTAKIPENLSVYCFYSDSDSVCPGEKAVFNPSRSDCKNKVSAFPMHGLGHFEYQLEEGVADKIVEILTDGAEAAAGGGETTSGTKVGPLGDETDNEDKIASSANGHGGEEDSFTAEHSAERAEAAAERAERAAERAEKASAGLLTGIGVTGPSKSNPEEEAIEA